MKLIKTSQLFLAIFITSLISSYALADNGEQIKKFGDYHVYYNAFNSSILTAKVAHQYGITRSSTIGVVNIAVLKGEGKDQTAIDSFITGNVKNLLSQKSTLKFKKVDEGEAIYYIATFEFSNQDDLTFSINVIPKVEKRSYSFKFHNLFYKD